jgi:DNA polymerase
MSVIRPEKVKVCQQCPFYEQALVPSEGQPDARIMIVGEAPAWEEVRAGRPFVGRAGQMLDSLLTDAQISRHGAYVANAIKCQIPEALRGQKAGGQVRSAMRVCRQRLAVEIRRLKPRVIIGLGDIALQSLTETRGITNARGEFVTLAAEYFAQMSRPPSVITTFHPAYLLRGKESYRPIVVRDLIRARRIIEGVSSEARHPVQYRTADTFGKALRLISLLKGRKRIAVDLETTGYNRKQGKILASALDYQRGKIFCFSFAFEEHGAWILPWFGGAEGPQWSEMQRRVLKLRLKELFETPGIMWILQNAQFDLRFLHRWIGVDVSLMYFHDIMIIQALVDENSKRDLETIALLHTDMGNYKQRITKRVKELK